MGLTAHSFDLLTRNAIGGESILELGNQTIFFGEFWGKSAKPMFRALGYTHVSVDMNGKDGAIKCDLSKPCNFSSDNNCLYYDIVTDFGTSEHVKDFYLCWVNKHHNCKVGGLIISENPKTGNWPRHGHHYITEDFYTKLAYMAGYEIVEIGEFAAEHNEVDGWNIYSVLKKTRKEFISLIQFETLDFRNE